MAVIKDPNLGIIGSLRPVVTFAQQRGRWIARKRKPKDKGPSGAAALRSQERFTRTAAAIKEFDESILEAWKELSSQYNCTWKDAATSGMLLAWHGSNMMPRTLQKISWTYEEPTLTVTLYYGNAYIEKGYGWGNLPWGQMPWGLPSALYTDEGYPVELHLQVTQSDVAPRSYKTFHSSPAKNFGKRQIPRFTPRFGKPLELDTAMNVDLRIEPLETNFREGYAESGVVPHLAITAAAHDFWGNDWGGPEAVRNPRLHLEVVTVGNDTTAQFIAHRTLYRVFLAETIPPEQRHLISSISYTFEENEDDNLDPAKFNLVTPYFSRFLPQPYGEINIAADMDIYDTFDLLVQPYLGDYTTNFDPNLDIAFSVNGAPTVTVIFRPETQPATGTVDLDCPWCFSWKCDGHGDSYITSEAFFKLVDEYYNR